MTPESKRKRVTGQIINLNGASKLAVAPQDIAALEAEKAIIGAVLQNPLVFASVSEFLQPGDFWTVWHGFVWYAFEQVANRNEGIDLITVQEELGRLNQWHGDEDMTRLADMVGHAPGSGNAEAYARQVREAATRMRVLGALDTMRAVVANRRDYTIDAAVDECNRLLFEATDQQKTCDDTRLSTIMADYLKTVEDAIEHGITAGIPTGYRALDDKLGGGAVGEVTVIAGGEGMGKTTFMLSLARLMAQIGLHVAIFSLEMSKQEITRIFTTMETGIPKITLKTFGLSPHQWGLFAEAAGKIGTWPVHIIDEYPTLSPIQARRRLRRMAQEEAIDVVLIDGLWLMEDSDGETERHRAVGNIMRDLVQVARDFRVPVYITHQYNGDAWNRAADKKRPILYDLAESAGVRRNTQVIMGLYRDAYYGIDNFEDVTELHILKDRNGSDAQGTHVRFKYATLHARFEEL